MNKHKFEVSLRGIEPDAVLIDDGGMLHKIHWLFNRIVNDLVDGTGKYIRKIIP